MRWCVCVCVLGLASVVACGDDGGGGLGDGPPLPDAAPDVDGARPDAPRADAAIDAAVADAAVADAVVADAAVDAQPPPDAALPDALPDAGTPPPVSRPCGTIQPTGGVLLDNGVDEVTALGRSGDRVLAG